MISQRKLSLGLLVAFLLLSNLSTAQEKPEKIKININYNNHTVPPPDHIALSSDDGYAVSVTVRNGKFDVPAEMPGRKTWCLAVVIVESQIQMCSLSRSEFAYENWTLYLADHRYRDHTYAVPKGAKIRSSCMLVLDSERIDPGEVIFQTHCRNAARNSKT